MFSSQLKNEKIKNDQLGVERDTLREVFIGLMPENW